MVAQAGVQPATFAAAALAASSDGVLLGGLCDGLLQQIKCHPLAGR